MISFREYLEESKMGSSNSARARKLKQEREKKASESVVAPSPEKEPPKIKNIEAENIETEEDIEDVDFEEFNMDEPHTTAGLMGKSFNGNIALLYENRHTPEAKRIKAYFSSENSPIQRNGELVFLTIRPDSVGRKGKNAIIINTIAPEAVRTMAQNFFKEIKTHAETDLFAGVYCTLKNQGVFEKPVKKLLKFYLPKYLVEDKNKRLDEIRKTLLSESRGTIHPNSKVEKDGYTSYLKYVGDDFSLFSYLVSYHILPSGKEVRLKQYTEEVMGIPAGTDGYSAPETPLFFGKRKTTNKDQVVLSTSGRDSKENVKKVEGITAPEIAKQKNEDDDEYEEEDKDSDKKLFSGLIATKSYSGKSINDFMDEYSKIEEVLNIVNSRAIMDLFVDGATAELTGESSLNGFSNLLNTSIKEIDNKVKENFKEYTKKDWKEDKRTIRDVQKSGSTFGKVHTQLKTNKQLEKLGDRARAGKENLQEGIRGYYKIEKDIISINKDLKELLNSGNKKIIKSGVNEKISQASEKIKGAAEKIILHYRKENSKYEKTLKSKIADIKDETKRIRGFDEPAYVNSLGHNLNIIKGNIKNLLNDLNRLLTLYNETVSVVTYKSQSEKERIEKIKSNEKDYGVLERKAFDRYSEEKLERQKVENSSKFLRKLKEIEEFVKEREAEGFGEIKMFADFKNKLIEAQKYYNRNLSETVIKKYDEIKFLSSKELLKRNSTLEKSVKKLKALKEIVSTKPENEVDEINYTALLSSLKGYNNNPSNNSYQDLVETLSLVSTRKTKTEKDNPQEHSSADAEKNKEKFWTNKEEERKKHKEETTRAKEERAKAKKINFPTSDEEIADATKPKESIEYTPEKAKKSIDLLKGLAEKLRNKTQKRKLDTAKTMQELMRMEKMIRDEHRTTQSQQAPPQSGQKMASLYFTEDVNTVSNASATLFEPFKQANDNIVILTNKASVSKTVEEIDNALGRIKRILLSTNRPEIIIPSYFDKIISNIDTIVSKIETLLDSNKIGPKEAIEYSGIVKLLITYLDNASLAFRNKLIDEIKRGDQQTNQNNISDNNIPSGAKPAITTRKVGEAENELDDKDNEGDENEDETEEKPEKNGSEKKNLLALAKEKLKAGK